ncbi:flagellar basal body P-ring formation chaperone FlgA [Aurantimonas sp. VKM B-3413]|uniref:flagellar basal body P-ring formation chaperone FlgA n=1 Tax=Aurantimonas sp. VKM B-3413 TaxID=2779401 RepID=UPI001E619DDD|nr:flagellar basal body P-ring formation chaperone FlgA [Aurantimonas sp. VKM B-3413]MCB8837926.1 flagellar basal body P-ring formation chaperone FlgA [Aurantimonas sp. VKM B-3413]
MRFASLRHRSALASRLATAAAVLVAALAGPASSAEMDMPVPVTVVYPGQSVLEHGLESKAFIVKDDKIELFVTSQSMLEGYVAKRTLLPGEAIRLTDLKMPDVVKAGTPVTMRYAADGLVITSIGTALRSAQEGETVRVRNNDSGVIVSGIVEHDGTVRIEG